MKYSILAFMTFVMILGISAKDVVAISAKSGDAALQQLIKKHGSFLKKNNAIVTDREPVQQRVILYTVNDSELSTPSTTKTVQKYTAISQNTRLHQEIWTRFTQSIPQAIHKNVTQFVLYTDGQRGSLGYVQQMAYGSPNWRLAVDYKDAVTNPTILYATLVHESAHLISLQNTEKSTVSASACKTVTVYSECMKNNSLLHHFYKEFWQGKTMKDWEKYGKANRSAFYNNYKASFVNSYAATSISEDFAETFTHFVFSKKPAATTIQNKKIRYFYKNSDMVTLRNDILTNINKSYH